MLRPCTKAVYNSVMKLTAYRRHLRTCDHRHKGQSYTLCACPIWVYGPGVRRALGTNNWERALGRIQIMAAGGALVEEPTGRTLATACEAFLADGTARSLSATTVRRYRVLLGHLRTFCGSVALADVNTGLLDRFRLSRRRTDHEDATPLEPGTLRTEIIVLRTFFRWCHNRRWIEHNPAQAVRLPKETAIGTLPFEPGEVRRLIAACDQIANPNGLDTTYIRRRARALVYVLLYSGLRISDVAVLRRDALDANGHLTIRHTQKTGVPIKVLLHSDAVKALNMLPATNPEYFFWSGKSTLKTACDVLANVIGSLGRLTGIHATAHRFRDTFAVELLTGRPPNVPGADIRTVQLLLGHGSVKTTDKHYARFVAAHQHALDLATAALDFEREPGRPLLVNPRRNRRRNA